MNKIKQFFFGLQRSTRITVISCGCFLGLTIVLLFIFVLCPITPSEKAIASFGREELAQLESDPVSTTVAEQGEDTETQTTVAAMEITTEYSQKIFTEDTTGFLTGGNIMTGSEGYEYPGQTSTQPAQTPNNAPTEPAPNGEPSTQPSTEAHEPTTQPSGGGEPLQEPTDAPVVKPTDPVSIEPVPNDPPAPQIPDDNDTPSEE